MNKKQKIDKLLKIVSDLIESTTFDSFLFARESSHIMSDATYQLLDDLHYAYRDIDFFDYEKRMGEGVTKAAQARATQPTKGDTNETD